MATITGTIKFYPFCPGFLQLFMGLLGRGILPSFENAMTLQGNGFGRREAVRPGAGGPIEAPSSAADSAFGRLGSGILFGAVIALVLGFTFVTVVKKYVGYKLNEKFVEAATPGAPDEAIKHVKSVDANLKN